MSSISRRIAVMTCSRPTGTAGVPGSVTSTASPASRASSSPRSSSARRASTAASSALRASLAARPTAPRSSGGSCGDAAQQVRQLGLAAEVGDPRLLQLGRAGGGRDRGGALAPAAARSSPSCARHPSDFVEADRRRHRGVERLRRGSGCGPPRRTRRATSGRQPFALGADHERHVAACSSSASGAARRAPPARPCGPGSSSTLDDAHDRHGEDRAHRGAHRLGAVRIRRARAERDAAGAERERRAQHRADVARVVDAPQRDAHRPGRRRRPALRVDGERARARAELGDLLAAGAARPPPPRAPSRPRTAAAPAASPPRAAASIRSSPSATNVRVLSRHLRPASLRTCLSCSLWGLVMGMCGRETKRAPVLSRRGAR